MASAATAVLEGSPLDLPAVPPAPGRRRLRGAPLFAAFANRNYRLFYAGQFVSLVGTWCQTVAQGVLVYSLTGSGVALGTVVALQFVPTLVLGALGGLVADRFDKRRTLLVVQAAMAVLALVQAVLTLTGSIEVWHLSVLALLTGLATTVDVPVRQSFVTELVGSDGLANAIGLNSAMFNGSRVVGPALAGVLIQLVGVGWCFAANALSFAAVLVGLWRMRPDELHRAPIQPRAKGQLREGFSVVARTPVLRRTIATVGVVAFAGFNFPVVLPVLADEVFHGGAGTYALLTGLMAAGSVAGALLVASRKRPTQRVLVTSGVAFGVLLAAAGLTSSLWVAAPLLVASGGAGIALMATANTTVQLTAAPALRGRVMAIYALVFLGSTPLGAPTFGWLVEAHGPRAALVVGGVVSLAAALVAARPLPASPAELRTQPSPA